MDIVLVIDESGSMSDVMSAESNGGHRRAQAGCDALPDQCSAACGKVFEPFWDECGKMLVESKMGGMKDMGGFCECCEWLPPSLR